MQTLKGRVIAHAGRRVDAEDADEPRFPNSHVGAVEQRIERVFENDRPICVVSGAACGADLVVLDVAGRLRIERVILLPSPPADFRRSSVTDRPGSWGERFDRAIAAVKPEVLRVQVGDAGYLELNLKILDRAEHLARKHRTSAAALVVWDGKARGADDVTQHFADNARQRRLAVVEIPTL